MYALALYDSSIAIPSDPASHRPALLQTNRQIRSEGFSVFYRINTFWVPDPDGLPRVTRYLLNMLALHSEDITSLVFGCDYGLVQLRRANPTSDWKLWLSSFPESSNDPIRWSPTNTDEVAGEGVKNILRSLGGSLGRHDEVIKTRSELELAAQRSERSEIRESMLAMMMGMG